MEKQKGKRSFPYGFYHSQYICDSHISYTFAHLLLKRIFLFFHKEFVLAQAATSSGGAAPEPEPEPTGTAAARQVMTRQKQAAGKNKGGKKRRGGPPHMLTCYICGEGFGSASLAIHEPQCLKKWDARNEQLPKGQRQPRPVKPE